MSEIFRVTFIGAGSYGFTRRLVTDLLSVPAFTRLEIALHDIDAEALEMIARLLQKDVDANAHPVTIRCFSNRRDAVQGARYVFNVSRIGGLEAFQGDVDIPLRYGVDQCVGDTLCAGGLMYAQRGIPFMLDLCADIRAVAEKDCLLLNYANPMAMLTWAAIAYGGVRAVGLCHGVQGGQALIAKALGVDADALTVTATGINHQTWYGDIWLAGRRISHDEVLAALEADPEISRDERVRIDMLRRFGAFSTESNGHLSEYLPWYRSDRERLTKWISDSCWIHGETAGYLRECIEQRAVYRHDFAEMLAKPSPTYGPEARSHEHGSYIVQGLETGHVYRAHVNLRNAGRIPNLPDDAIVEIPAYCDYAGINAPKVDALPLGCAAVCQRSIDVQRLGVHAALTGDDALLRQAMLLDPLVGAVCDPPAVWQMVDELLVAQAEWLPQYQDAIAAAKQRLAPGLQIAVMADNRGAARREVASIEAMAGMSAAELGHAHGVIDRI